MKKPLKVLSAAGFASVLAASALVAPVSAAVDQQVLKDAEGKQYAYDYKELQESFTEYLRNSDNAEAALYKNYLKKQEEGSELVAFRDTVNGYVEYANVSDAFTEALRNGTADDFDKDAFTESSEAIKTELTNVFKVTVSEDGSIVETPVEAPVEKLSVESVSAITTTTVDVAITAPEKDVLGATVEVKDGAGNVVEVNSVDISAGDKVASFTFKKAVKAEDLTGVWTVDGKEFSFTAINQLTDITDAASATTFNELTLFNALEAAGIENVDTNKMVDYKDAIVDANPETLADVQKAVDAVNKKATETADQAAAVKAVEEATNQIQLLNALKANFDHVNDSWIASYAAGKVGNADTTTADSQAGFIIDPVKENANEAVLVSNAVLGDSAATALDFDNIQDVINTVNDEQVAAAYDKAFKSLKSTDVSNARTLANTYLSTDADAPITKKDWANDSLDILDALIRVNAATTNNTLKNALVALDNLENTLVEKYKNNSIGVTVNNVFEIKDVNDDLLAAYRTKLADTDVLKKNQPSDIKTFIIDPVNSQAATTLLNNVKNADSPDKLLAALKAYPGLKQVADINKASYFGSDATNDFAGATAVTIQGLVDTANIAAIAAADTSDKVLAALKVLELDNVVDANKAQYLADKANYTTNKTTIKNAVDASNKVVAVDAAVDAINKAETATQVKTALDALANSGKLDAYLEVTGADRIFIAEQVLEARAEETDEEYAADTDVATAVTAATEARTGTLIAVNALTIDDSLTDIANALLLVGHESLTGTAGSVTALGVVTPGTVTANDTNVADKFITSVQFDDAGAIVPQFRSISSIRTAITEATK